MGSLHQQSRGSAREPPFSARTEGGSKKFSGPLRPGRVGFENFHLATYQGMDPFLNLKYRPYPDRDPISKFIVRPYPGREPTSNFIGGLNPDRPQD